MTSLYDLKKEHLEALADLEFAETDEEIHETLNRIQGEVTRKLEFLTTLLAEAISKSDVSKEAYRSVMERLAKNKKRDERIVEKLRDFILQTCIDFNIKKFTGTVCSVSHGLTPGSLVFVDSFDVNQLPADYVITIPEHKEPNKKLITEALRKEIYDEDLKKLNPDIAVAINYALPGVMLERTESLRVS